MRTVPAALAALLTVSLLSAAAAVSAQDAVPAGDTCLMLAARNISAGGNFFLYAGFSDKNVKFKAGDVLTYEIFLDPRNPQAQAGLDVVLQGAPAPDLRDSGITDAEGRKTHPGTELTSAVGTWMRRTIPLDRIAGATGAHWSLAVEGDAAGQYVQFVDNVVVSSADGTTAVVYADGPPEKRELRQREGYSQHFVLTAIPRSQVSDGQDLTARIDLEVKKLETRQKAETLRKEIEAAGQLAAATDDPASTTAVNQALAELNALETSATLDAEALNGTLQRAEGKLGHLHPLMQKFTGHLVGHAHIDFQWLWEWPETLTVCRDTFGQAIKFMDEFPGFTFTQSSTALYQATEEAWPELFRSIQERVETGQWELVGGRVCEGDTHTISPESHARHFLYGQRYFRERFNGRDAVVGWEPDTFGHCWTMPQILKHGGCKYYYFCRGGFDAPLFWWESPDGSRVLAFEEPATGSWYNADVSYKQIEEAAKFEQVTDSKDMLWVYGVGNHGGGPTRENIEIARGWQAKPYLPKAKFSTATDFFKALENCDLTTIPVIGTELNTTRNSGFFGCYTTHGDIKKWNRDAEAATESAEAIAAFAAQTGFKYPREEFRRNWEEITWNHHHDTLPGTSIHASYDKSERMYLRTIASSRRIGEKALAHLARRVKGEGDGVVVFNPLGWKRNGMIEVDVPPSKRGTPLFATAGDGKVAALQPVQGKPGRAVFYAEDVPSYGWRRYRIDKDLPPDPGARIDAEGTTLENNRYKVELDTTAGLVTSVYDKWAEFEGVAPGGTGNRLEVHWEEPNGMSAWTIGKIAKVEALTGAVETTVTENGPARVTVKWTRRFGKTDLVQTVSLPAKGAPEFSLDTQWNELGSGDGPNPFLKVAFDVNATSPTQTYEIPYGTIARPGDGTEYPALKWADSTDTTGGAAILNDSKHGYSAEGNTLRLSLIRSSYYPDPRPNDRPQSTRWSYLPHAGDWKDAGTINRAAEFNKPLWSVAAGTVEHGTLPAHGSFLGSQAESVIITGVKQAEDDDDLIVRFYEAWGEPAQASFQTLFPVTESRSVNFIEDEIALENGLNSRLGKSEIKTLKLTVGKGAARH